MSETTALAKGKEAPGPLAKRDEQAYALLYDRDANQALRALPKVAVMVATFVGMYSYVAWDTHVLVPVGTIAGSFVALAGFYTWRVRRVVRSGTELFQLAELGRLDEVVAKHDAVARRLADPFQRASVVHDLGYYELRRGHLDRALAILSTVYQATTSRRLRTIAANNLSMAYLANGDIEAAEAWLPDSPADVSDSPLATTATHARRRRWDELLELDWPDQTPRSELPTRHSRRLFFLLRAFARKQRGDPDGAAIDAELEAARPAYAGEYDYLTQQWPDLRAFVADRCLPPRSAPDAEGLPPARLVEKR